MSFDRRWLEEVGSEDSHGRALWALGACVGRSRRPDLPSWAASHFDLALQPVLEMTSPRAWAFSLLGIRDYLRRFEGERLTGQFRDALVDRLVGLYEHAATSDWLWFEDILTYDNARLPHALIAAGRDRAIASAGDRLESPAMAGRGPESRRTEISGRSAATGSTTRGTNGRGSISSPSRRMPPSPPVWKPTVPPRMPPGCTRPDPPSNGSWAATTWGRSCTTRPPAGAATASTRPGSTGTRARNQPLLFSSPLPR